VSGRGALLGPEGTCLGGRLLVRVLVLLLREGVGAGAGRSGAWWVCSWRVVSSVIPLLVLVRFVWLVVGVGAGCRGGVLVA
jgi:hypothetical protein